MTTMIELPATLKRKVEQAASARGLSLDEFVQEVLEWVLVQPDATDPLFTDAAVYTGEAPADLSAHHDQYLYGDVS